MRHSDLLKLLDKAFVVLSNASANTNLTFCLSEFPTFPEI